MPEVTSTEHGLPTTEGEEGHAEVWSPFDVPRARTFTITYGSWSADVVMRPWTTAERIGWEDASATSFMTKGEDGEASVRMGRLNATHLTTVIQDWSGFPEKITRQPTERERERAKAQGSPLGDVLVEGTDLRRLEHVRALHPGVYLELLRLARLVQPLPGAEARAQATPDGTVVVDDPEDGSEGEQDDDPSPTPPTTTVRQRAPRAASPARGGARK